MNRETARCDQRGRAGHQTFATIRTRFAAFDDRLDAWADRHWPMLGRLGHGVSFLLLFGGVALHAYGSGFARFTAAQCGPACSATRATFALAALFGGAAVLVVALFAGLAAALQRALLDPFQHVRPGPPPCKVARWVGMLHVLIGIALFLAMAGLGIAQNPGRFVASLHGGGMLGLALGWWIGAGGVLKFFWLKVRGHDVVAARRTGG